MPTQTKHYVMEITDCTVKISKCHPGPELELLGVFNGDIGESMSLWLKDIEALHALYKGVVIEENNIDTYYGGEK